MNALMYCTYRVQRMSICELANCSNYSSFLTLDSLVKSHVHHDAAHLVSARLVNRRILAARGYRIIRRTRCSSAWTENGRRTELLIPPDSVALLSKHIKLDDQAIIKNGPTRFNIFCCMISGLAVTLSY